MLQVCFCYSQPQNDLSCWVRLNYNDRIEDLSCDVDLEQMFNIMGDNS